MGCGNSTPVQTFTPPEENKTRPAQKPRPTQEQQQRVSSASSSTKGGKSKKKRGSITSSLSSIGSATRRQNVNNSRVSTGNTKTTYTIHRASSSDRLEDENENTQQTNNFGRQYKHETLQKETFLTGNYRGQEFDWPDWPEPETPEQRQQKHEERAKTKEAKRAKLDYEKQEEEEIQGLDLCKLEFPSMDHEEGEGHTPPQSPLEYTVDDIVSHNELAGVTDWFKYGKKIYSWNKMKPIIRGRIFQYADRKFMTCEDGGYPVYVARRQGVTRKELKEVLDACVVGNEIPVIADDYLSRMKQDVEGVVEDPDNGTESDTSWEDQKNQMYRWLKEYPNIPIYNKLPETGKDPNEAPFPLPSDILADPSVLRSWVDSFEWDFEMPEGGYFDNSPTVYSVSGTEHDDFCTLVASHQDKDLPDVDMEIEGDVAWNEIKLDLLKDDVTTEKQDEIWTLREKRSNLDSEEWMEMRRMKLFEVLSVRHEWDTSHTKNYIGFYDVMKRDWEKFLELCEGEFKRPEKESRVDQDHAVVASMDNGDEAELRPQSRESIGSKHSHDNRSINGDIVEIRPGSKASVRSKASSSKGEGLNGTINNSRPTSKTSGLNGMINNSRPTSKTSVRSKMSTDNAIIPNGVDHDGSRPTSKTSIRSKQSNDNLVIADCMDDNRPKSKDSIRSRGTTSRGSISNGVSGDVRPMSKDSTRSKGSENVQLINVQEETTPRPKSSESIKSKSSRASIHGIGENGENNDNMPVVETMDSGLDLVDDGVDIGPANTYENGKVDCDQLILENENKSVDTPVADTDNVSEYSNGMGNKTPDTLTDAVDDGPAEGEALKLADDDNEDNQSENNALILEPVLTPTNDDAPKLNNEHSNVNSETNNVQTPNNDAEKSESNIYSPDNENNYTPVSNVLSLDNDADKSESNIITPDNDKNDASENNVLKLDDDVKSTETEEIEGRDFRI